MSAVIIREGIRKEGLGVRRARPQTEAGIVFGSAATTPAKSDEDGVELPTLRAAEMEAARALGAMAQELEPTAEGQDMAIEVRNEDGPLFQVALVFAVRRPKH